MKKILISLCAFFSLISIASAETVTSDEPASCESPRIEVFVRDGCGHCAEEEEYLKTITNTEINLIDINSTEGRALFNRVTGKYELSKVTPITLVGNQIIIGFSDATKIEIERSLENDKHFYTFEKSLEEDICINVYGREKTCTLEGNGDESCSTDTTNNFLKNVPIPFMGTVDLSSYALPTISVILGFVDGFNPCAMWVLVAFLVALIQIGDRFKMFLTAGIFIIAESIMYALIMGAWSTVWNFASLGNIVPIIVGLVAVGAAMFFLYEGFFSDGTCKVTNVEQRKKISQKIKDLSESPITIGFFIAILGLAFSVNIIEFACSIGIPQTFTEILKLSGISLIKQIFYIAIYILFYMIDDLIVFGIAIYSIEKIGITHKYARASNIIGGIIMLILGIILLFKPELIGTIAG